MSTVPIITGKALDDHVGVKHHFAAHVYAKEMTLAKGDTLGTHRHAYDHLSILAMGVVLLTVEGETTRYAAPACIEIKRGIEHRIHALEATVWYCIHPTDETDTTKIDQVLIERT